MMLFYEIYISVFNNIVYAKPNDIVTKTNDSIMKPLAQEGDFVDLEFQNQEKKHFFSNKQLILLNDLKTRRETLNKYEKELNLKEIVLRSIQDKIKEEASRLSKLENRVNSLINNFNNLEQNKIDRLTKIYSKMMPKEAARIIEELDVNVAIQVVMNMKERNIAEIMEKMNSQYAKKITQQLAIVKKIN